MYDLVQTMMKNRLISLILLLTAGTISTGSETNAQSAQNLQISLLTCSPGKEIYSIYGHNAIRIRDREGTYDYVYNYGTFDFHTPGFALKFLRGKLPYLLSINNFNRFLDEYNYLKRDVTEQVLQTDSVSAAKILNFLTENYKPENRAYPYDFFYDNCATRLRDVINTGWEGRIVWDEAKSTGKTFRTIIKEYQAVWPWLNFGVDLIIGAKADKPASLQETMFIPDYLMQAIGNCEINYGSTTGPITKMERIILKFDRNQQPSFIAKLWHPVFIFSLFLLFELVIFMRSMKGKNQAFKYLKQYDKIWLYLSVLSGLFMLFMWFGTDHQACSDNWNILWTLAVLPLFFFRMIGDKLKVLLYAVMILLLGISAVNSIPGIQILPQYFHPVAGLISGVFILKLLRFKSSEYV